MKTHSRVGMTIAGLSIAFSTLSFGVYFAFTPVFALSVLIGAVGVAFAVASQARRTAIVTAVFALVPLGQLLVETFFDNELLVLLPATLAVATAAWAIGNYASRRKVQVGAAA